MSHEEHLGTEEPPLQASLQPQSSTMAVSQWLPLLCPLSSPDTQVMKPGTQGCLESIH